MGRSDLHFICLFMIVICILPGCAYHKLVSPGAPAASLEPLSAPRLEGLKFSYSVNTLESSGSTEYLEKALYDSFSEAGIHDVIKSTEFSSDRIYVSVNILSTKPTTLGRYALRIPLAIISGFSMGVIPAYDFQIHPVEIHVVDIRREQDEQFKVIQAEYRTATWIWLPLGFMLMKETNEDAIYVNMIDPNPDKRKMARLEYVTYRRIFDGLVRELAR